MLENFEHTQLNVNGVSINLRHGGNGPPLLLLHGFPQTHVIWHKVADGLSKRFTLVMPDLRGYGDSSKPLGAKNHENYSKRTMAQDMVEVMHTLGYQRFHVCGHDRGGRVAHRLALDHASAVDKLMLIDIAPTLTMYDATDMRFATLYYHWFMLIQPAPLPETLIGESKSFFLQFTLSGWGSQGADFIDPRARAEYERCFCTDAAVHAACEDYRAAATIDLEHDLQDRKQERKLDCVTHVVWGEMGVIGMLFNPVADWQAVCDNQVTGTSLQTGHFIAEQDPVTLLCEMLAFFN